MPEVPYWDVFPKSIKVSQGSGDVPLSVRGTPTGTVQFDSANLGIASVDEAGFVCLGGAGATMITVYDSDERTSARYISVEVVAAEVVDA